MQSKLTSANKRSQQKPTGHQKQGGIPNAKNLKSGGIAVLRGVWFKGVLCPVLRTGNGQAVCQAPFQ